jgi:hypothetical protein
MLQSGQNAYDGTLIEPQGVNAGSAIDAEATPEPREDPSDAVPAPTPYELSQRLPDEMVGLPEQKPGYPGQQRSMDTS